MNKRYLAAFAAVAWGSASALGQASSSSDVVTFETLNVSEMRSFSDQAIPGETPVAFSEVGKERISAQLGSRDLPLVLNNTPSIYATADGGGAGDARINVRGFSQRNVSILINGVPTNDLENGWLYWSNWDALGDVTSTIQIQRGLSNVTLPTPSIGGTINIITDPAAAKRGGSFKVETGSGNFMKATAVLNTGLLKDKFALTVGLMAKEGDGFARGTWVEGYGYYIGSSWIVNDKNRLELFAIGAPQRHGQRTFASNIAAYDAGFARKLGYSQSEVDAARAVGPISAGDEFNPNYSPVSPSYTGQQYFWGSTHSRKQAGFINERENYFHKPQINLNWYLTLNEQLKLTTVAYYSGGDGGGTGTLNNGSSSAAFGRISNSDYYYGSNIDWDATIASNAGTTDVRGNAKAAGQSLGVLRNSVNQQDQFGVVSKLSYEMTDSLSFTTGVDWRTAKIDHFREVRDLLGGDYYLPTVAQASEFWANGANTRLGLGDRVDYDNTNTVDWLGLFAQAQYQEGPISAFAVYGYSLVDYSYEDNFRRAAPGSSQKYKLDPGADEGHQIKGGVQYKFTQNLAAFVNAGWVSKVPNFDGVINDTSGVLVNTGNEKFTSFESGLRFDSDDKRFNVSASYYYTLWRDRSVSTVNEVADTITYLRGVNSNYAGLEIESAFQPNRWFRVDAAASFGNWYYTGDVTGEVFQISSGSQIGTGSDIYIAGLKVGDAPQTQVAVGATVFPTDGLSIRFEGRWYDRYWADFLPESRTDATDRGQAWSIPDYEIFDLHVSYRLPLNNRAFDVSVFAHVFNVFDKVYVSDATDNSSFEGIAGAPSHSAQRAEVFLGLPATYNLGVSVSF